MGPYSETNRTNATAKTSEHLIPIAPGGIEVSRAPGIYPGKRRNRSSVKPLRGSVGRNKSVWELQRERGPELQSAGNDWKGEDMTGTERKGVERNGKE